MPIAARTMRAAADRGDREKPVEAAPEERGEPRPENRPEPRYERPERHENRPEPRHEGRSEPRYEGRSEQRFEQQRPEPVLLPGESISKYQPQASHSAATPHQAPVKTDSQPRPKPSTEFSLDASAFSAGSFPAGVLPGESLAKYGKKAQPARTATETAEPEPAAIEQALRNGQHESVEREERGFLQDSESAGPVPRQFQQQEEAQARVEAPAVFHRREPAEASARSRSSRKRPLPSKKRSGRRRRMSNDLKA